MAAKKNEAAPVAAAPNPLRVTRAIVTFVIGQFDDLGHLRHEEPAQVQPVELLYPFDGQRERLLEVVEKVEAAYNSGAAGG